MVVRKFQQEFTWKKTKKTEGCLKNSGHDDIYTVVPVGKV